MSFGPPPSPFTQSRLEDDGRRKRRRLWVLSVSGAVFVLLGALCAGVWGLQGGGAAKTPDQTRVRQHPDDVRETVDKAPRSPEGERLMEWDEDDLKPTETRNAPATWVTDKVIARGMGHGILSGVTIKSGETAWKDQLDGVICATTQHVTVDGRTAVVTTSRMPQGGAPLSGCNHLIFLDVDTGRKLWQTTLPQADSASVLTTNVTMTRGTVAVGWGEGSAAYRMDDGKELWKSSGTSACRDRGFAGGRSLLALVSCGEIGDSTLEVQKIDPKTGKPAWSYKLAHGVKSVFLPSSDPPVIAVEAGDAEVTDLITLDAKGGHRATISLGGHYDPMCSQGGYGTIDRCDALVVGRDQVFVASKDQPDIRQPSNWIVSFDLATGKTVRKFDGRPGESIYPVRMNGDKLLAYRPNSVMVGLAAVVSLDPRTGKQAPFLLFGLDDHEGTETSDPSMTDVIVHRGAVFLAPRQLSEDSPGKHKYALVAVGIKSVG
ncbi:outer membrane protein assembly factor BamB family protein [Streptomyces sp. NPDC002004]